MEAMMKRLIVTMILLLSCSTPLLADYPLEIIELKGRTVEEMIPIVEPLLPPYGSVSGMNNQLILRTSPENLAEIKKLLAKVDHPPRQLIIRVRQGAAATGSSYGSDVGINADLGKDIRVTAGENPPDDGVRYRIHSTNTRNKMDSNQHVRTLEGRPVFITTGRSVPITEATTTIAGNVVHQQQTTRYKDVTTGFYATPRLQGDRVILAISSHMEREGHEHRSYDIQRTNTTVSGNLGEWISVGGTSNSGSGENQGLLHNRSTRDSDEHSIYLLVEEDR
jgi:type II secretory pathway component GspD/PulD (secretin)